MTQAKKLPGQNYPPPSAQGTLVGNGRKYAPATDGRSLWARRAKEVFTELLHDLGGPTNTSAAERSLMKRGAALTVELERYEQKFSLNEHASVRDLDIYLKAANTLRRILVSIGLDVRVIDVSPTLSQYLRSMPPTNTAPDAEVSP
jgi:hypothetical protein